MYFLISFRVPLVDMSLSFGCVCFPVGDRSRHSERDRRYRRDGFSRREVLRKQGEWTVQGILRHIAGLGPVPADGARSPGQEGDSRAAPCCYAAH